MPVRRIYADISELFVGAEELVLDADATSGSSTITVKSITGAAINNVLCLRQPGGELSEIILTHGSTAPSGNTVTLASNLTESHPRGTTVYILPYNTVRFYHAATEVDANSDDSSLTALAAAQSIDPTMFRNIYDDTAQSSGYYYYRFINSLTSVNSLYNGPIPWGASEVSYADDQIGYMLESVRRKLGKEWDERFSKQDAIDEANACLRFAQGKQKKMSRYLVQDYVIGQTARGVFDANLPTDIYDSKTNKSVLNVRIKGLEPLVILDEKEWDELFADVAHTEVRTQPSIGATSLNIDNSYDFDDDGTISIFTSNAKDEITYTGVTRSATAGVLTGIPGSGDGSIAATHAVDTDVWQGESEGAPRYANVKDGKLRYWPLPDSTQINKNVVMDYYNGVTRVDSEEDHLDVDRYDMVKHWLLWQGKAHWNNNGKIDLKDEDYQMFTTILKDQIRTSVSGQKNKWRPKLNTIDYAPTGGADRGFDET
jgi:hypothetical protein